MLKRKQQFLVLGNINSECYFIFLNLPHIPNKFRKRRSEIFFKKIVIASYVNYQ